MLKRKINIKFPLCSLKTPTDNNSKDCSKSRNKFLFWLSLSLVDFPQCILTAGIRNNFLDHRRLSEQILDLQAAIGKPEQASLKRVTGRTFTVRKWFYWSKQRLYFECSSQNNIQKIVVAKYKMCFCKVVDIFFSDNIILLSWTQNFLLISTSLRCFLKHVHKKRYFQICRLI